MNGVQLKQFINRVLHIPKGKLRAEVGKTWAVVFIMSEPRTGKDINEPFHYLYRFPPEFTNRCMRIVYPDSEQLCQQATGGNISSVSIAMHRDQWNQLYQQFHDDESIAEVMRQVIEHDDQQMVAAAEADADAKGGDIDAIRPADRIVG
jgi:hypothetical protein